MPFLYGNHVVKAHLGRITEDTPEHQGVVVFSMSDVPLVSINVSVTKGGLTYCKSGFRCDGTVDGRHPEIRSNSNNSISPGWCRWILTRWSMCPQFICTQRFTNLFRKRCSKIHVIFFCDCRYLCNLKWSLYMPENLDSIPSFPPWPYRSAQYIIRIMSMFSKRIIAIPYKSLFLAKS
jgi:hypothetical protein